ncbi:hypothetical protein ACKLNR_007070 [Fusarium oxysporum f. sp. zingiberi]|uniref:BPTI/Kunitz inhibitor domain-containing protein n=1 Tax=Fusarium oxysporum TaxID=5507 RepID=A0A420NUX5_FUSOX|nr:hypothetical protein BFJ69_g2318 [Fusarium oxysporum]
MKLIAFRKSSTIPNTMPSLTIAVLFLLGLVNAGVVRTPAEAATLTTETTAPVATPDAFVAKGEKMASCNIQCAFWYQKCYYAPWSYSCGNDGRFRRHEWNPICEKNCWCNCDSK